MLLGSLSKATENFTTSRNLTGAFSLINDAWLPASAEAEAALETSIDRRLSPHFEVSLGNRSVLNKRLLYFNLHGFDGESFWSGHDARGDFFSKAITPLSFSATQMAGSAIITAACYGAQVSGGRTPTNSCALAAQREGAAAFVGATGLVFGSYQKPTLRVADADKFASFVIRRLARGERSGVALLAGRREFVESCAKPLTVYEQKTALQFVLIGDPSLTAA